MRVLLVQPYAYTVRGLPQAPLALMLMGGSAQKRGHTVKILDRNFETNSRKIIDEFKPDVVGITSLTGRMLLDGLTVSSYIKQTRPRAKVIWGGVHVSVLPENSLQESVIDFVVIGEGEETFVELLDAIEKNLDCSRIQGIGYKQNGLIIINERRPPLKNLDDVPLMPWPLVDPRRYLKHETLMITSRGCPHRCAFCYNEKVNFRRWRAMSPERVKREIDHAQSFHTIKRFRFDDDNFCVDKKRFHAILDFLPRDTSLYFSSRIEYVDEEFCRHLAEFKDAFVLIGLESGDDEELRRLQKDITVEQIRHGFELLNKYKIQVSASFIIGAPGQTRQQVEKTLALIDEVKPTRPSCCIFVPHPGSIFSQQLIQEGRLDHIKTMRDWGHHTDAEISGEHQYSQLSQSEIKKIYNRYWRQFIWTYVRKGLWGWILLGAQNALVNYWRLWLRKWHRDLM